MVFLAKDISYSNMLWLSVKLRRYPPNIPGSRMTWSDPPVTSLFRRIFPRRLPFNKSRLAFANICTLLTPQVPNWRANQNSAKWLHSQEANVQTGSTSVLVMRYIAFSAALAILSAAATDVGSFESRVISLSLHMPWLANAYLRNIMMQLGSVWEGVNN